MSCMLRASGDFDVDAFLVTCALKPVAIFIQEQQVFIASLRDFPGVESVSLDFGAEIHPPGWCSFNVPSNLMLACGSLDITLTLSVYPIDPTEADKSGQP